MKRGCSVPECEEKHSSHGYCNRHAKAWKAHGDPLGGKRRISAHGGPYPNAKGYLAIRIDGRQVLEHRLVMEQHLGRALEPQEVIHHINGDKADNRIENLALTTHSQHAAEHHYVGVRNETHKTCSKCGALKPRTDFTERTTPGRDPHLSRCKPCRTVDSEARRATIKPTCETDRPCKRGHPRTPENIYVWPKTGLRSCRACNAIHAASYKVRRRQQG